MYPQPTTIQTHQKSVRIVQQQIKSGFNISKRLAAANSTSFCYWHTSGNSKFAEFLLLTYVWQQQICRVFAVDIRLAIANSPIFCYWQTSGNSVFKTKISLICRLLKLPIESYRLRFTFQNQTSKNGKKDNQRYMWKSPSGHMTCPQRRINVNATS